MLKENKLLCNDNTILWQDIVVGENVRVITDTEPHVNCESQGPQQQRGREEIRSPLNHFFGANLRISLIFQIKQMNTISILSCSISNISYFI